jgi:hypothetical protein
LVVGQLLSIGVVVDDEHLELSQPINMSQDILYMGGVIACPD